MCTCEFDPVDDADRRTAEERARQAEDFNRVHRAAWRRLNPTPEERHLGALGFAAGVLVERRRRGLLVPTTEEAQYVLLYTAKAEQLGVRDLPPLVRQDLRRASELLWCGVKAVEAIRAAMITGKVA